jgi:hypothetical protein
VTLYWPPVLGVPEMTPAGLMASPGGRPEALKVRTAPAVLSRAVT